VRVTLTTVTTSCYSESMLFTRTFEVTLSRPMQRIEQTEEKKIRVKAYTRRSAGLSAILQTPGLWGVTNIKRV